MRENEWKKDWDIYCWIEDRIVFIVKTSTSLDWTESGRDASTLNVTQLYFNELVASAFLMSRVEKN